MLDALVASSAEVIFWGAYYDRDTTVWGGVPCVALIDSVTDQAGFEAHVDKLFAELGSARRLILGVSDNFPPDGNLASLIRLGSNGQISRSYDDFMRFCANRRGVGYYGVGRGS